MKKFYLLAMCFFLSVPNIINAQRTGYVLINEYLPWTLQSCPSTSEFVELYNFGPGPVNLGCYIVTDAHRSITIPPNTILNPGQFFVISGMDSIELGCSNIDFVTHVDLNWITCNCTSSAIPSTSPGWLTDGGSANDPIVLFDPGLKVVDAVVRKLPQELATPITTSNVGGACTSKTFNLDTMGIEYEIIGESAGRGNSFARKVDGDCIWVKDPQQSGGTTNNRSGGAATSLTTVLSLSNPVACNNNGSISISFTGISDYSNIFPVSYILGRDADKNNIFDLNDIYTNGIDSTPPTVNITGLAPGTYHLAIEPKSGCNYQFYSFTILPCNLTTLEPNTIIFFAKKGQKNAELSWVAEKMERIQKFEVERSANGVDFEKIQIYKITLHLPSSQKFKYFDSNPMFSSNYYRIKIFYNNNTFAYSPVEKITVDNIDFDLVSLYPNPVKNLLTINFDSDKKQNLSIELLQPDGKIIRSIRAEVNVGPNDLKMETTSVIAGIYHLKIYKADGNVVVKRVVKE